MQYHHYGYVDHDPRIRPAEGTGIDRPDELPDEMDILIVGSGPAGAIQAAQLTNYPSIHTRIIERRPHRLGAGRADGLFPRSSETFQAFEFYEPISAEAAHMREMNFWGPNPDNPAEIVRLGRAPDPPKWVSEFPILIVNQARVIDYFTEYAANGPARIKPDYGWTFLDLVNEQSGEYPIKVRLQSESGEEKTVRAKYVVGCDGARSKVRDCIDVTVNRDEVSQAWAVLDIIANTDFPDFRIRGGIQSAEHGSILLIPREGGFMTRFYVSLDTPTDETRERILATTDEEAIAKANRILHPYSVDVKNVGWRSIYEVRHSVAQQFDDVAASGDESLVPRVFLAGDACHTHSAKAGQGMNVSMQDGWNIAWKLGQVLTGLSDPSLLRTYHDERQDVAQKLIDFDKRWSKLMSRGPDELDNPNEIIEFFVETANFPGGFDTKYLPSRLVGSDEHQELAKGFPLGMRFKSAPVSRISDTNTVQVGHHFRADGRWRIYVFADRDATELNKFAEWMEHSPDSPVTKFTPAGADLDAVFDAKVIYQQGYHDLEMPDTPTFFRPKVGPYQARDHEKVYGVCEEHEGEDFFDARGISRDGAIVVVRPDMYVANVLPLTARDELTEFFGGIFLPQN